MGIRKSFYVFMKIIWFVLWYVVAWRKKCRTGIIWLQQISASNMREKLAGKNQYVNYEEDYPEQIKRMREEFSDIKEDSNPCVVIYSF